MQADTQSLNKTAQTAAQTKKGQENDILSIRKIMSATGLPYRITVNLLILKSALNKSVLT